MRTMVQYKLIVKLPDIKLTFNIEGYEILDSGYYKIFDEKTQTYRIFDSRICELIEVKREWP